MFPDDSNSNVYYWIQPNKHRLFQIYTLHRKQCRSRSAGKSVKPVVLGSTETSLSVSKPFSLTYQIYIFNEISQSSWPNMKVDKGQPTCAQIRMFVQVGAAVIGCSSISFGFWKRKMELIVCSCVSLELISKKLFQAIFDLRTSIAKCGFRLPPINICMRMETQRNSAFSSFLQVVHA